MYNKIFFNANSFILSKKYIVILPSKNIRLHTYLLMFLSINLEHIFLENICALKYLKSSESETYKIWLICQQGEPEADPVSLNFTQMLCNSIRELIEASKSFPATLYKLFPAHDRKHCDNYKLLPTFHTLGCAVHNLKIFLDWCKNLYLQEWWKKIQS